MRFHSKIPIRELLSSFNLEEHFVGDKDGFVLNFCDDFYATEGSLTWTENQSTLNRLLAKNTNITIIANVRERSALGSNNIILCDNPLRLFETIIDRYFCCSWHEPSIGKHSVVPDSVVLGKNVSIGEHCIISPYVVIGNNVTIGDNVEIGPFSSIGTIPYYISLDKNNRMRSRKIYGCTIIDNDVHIGSHCSIDSGITCETIIGKKSKLGNYVEIGHDVRIGNNCGFCAQTAISGFVTIGNDCFFWGKSGVSNRITIASNTTLLASSILTKSVFVRGCTLCGFPAVDRIKYWRGRVQDRKH